MSKSIRVDKVLSNMGYGTRTQIKKQMKKGIVTLNGEVIKKPGTLMNPDEDVLTYFGDEVEYREHIYLVMNKPQGLISATCDDEHLTIIDVLQPEDKVFSPFPVGRLDLDTEGIIFITNDGKFSYKFTSPNKRIDKVYYVEVAEDIEENYHEEFEKGIYFKEEDYRTLPATLEVFEDDKKKCYLTIQEGKYHQVKRMFLHMGNEVTFLKRVKIADFELPEELEPGEYRELTEEEVEHLINLDK